MKTPPMQCRDEWVDQFLAGGMPEAEVTELEHHLEHCRHCDSRLASLSADQDFWIDAHEFLSDAGDLPTLERKSTWAVDEVTQFDSVNGSGYCDIPLQPTDDPHMLGRFGGYEISGIIGRGGMGVVLKGWDISLDRYVAIKVLNPSYSHQSAARQRFAREAKAAAAVVHDNVVAIYGVDSCNDLPFLVMPYVRGESLQRRIDRAAPLSIEEILEISLQIARGLQAAHDQGLVHRDIKPANILLPQSVSRVVITDFGLARAADDATLTCSGVIAGTPAYMSPEQARGQAVDGRTDLFSLGSVMYAMACGHPPFRSETSYGVLRRITDDPHRRLSELQHEIPRWFESIVDRLLEKKPEHRFESAAAVASHLEDCLAHLRQPNHLPLPQLTPSNRVYRRWWVLVATIVIGLVCGVWLLAMMATSGNTPTPASLDETELLMQWDYDDRDLDRLESMLRELNEEFE